MCTPVVFPHVDAHVAGLWARARELSVAVPLADCPAADPVPVYTSLKSIYETPDEARYANIAKVFRDTFGTAPEFFVRAPGRVNIIGELTRGGFQTSLCRDYAGK